MDGYSLKSLLLSLVPYRKQILTPPGPCQVRLRRGNQEGMRGTNGFTRFFGGGIGMLSLSTFSYCHMDACPTLRMSHERNRATFVSQKMQNQVGFILHWHEWRCLKSIMYNILRSELRGWAFSKKISMPIFSCLLVCFIAASERSF